MNTLLRPLPALALASLLWADESCVVSKDEGVTWDDIASRLPSDWWSYAITHQYSVISQKY